MVKTYEDETLVETVRILRDGMLALQDRDGENAIINEYTWGLNLGGGISRLLNLAQNSQNYSYLYDGKGNVEAILDPTQVVVAAYRYDPFGRLLVQTGSLTQPFGFSTKRYKPQVGMLHYQYRNYLTEIGRWDSRDPLGETEGINCYAFSRAALNKNVQILNDCIVLFLNGRSIFERCIMWFLTASRMLLKKISSRKTPLYGHCLPVVQKNSKKTFILA